MLSEQIRLDRPKGRFSLCRNQKGGVRVTTIDCGRQNCKHHGAACRAKKVKWRGGRCLTFDDGELHCSIRELMQTNVGICQRKQGKMKRKDG